MNDETTKTPGPSGPSTPAGGEHAGAKKRRRRKSGKPAVLSAKAQPAPADAALPHKAKKSRRRKMSDEIAADPTAAIRDRIFEIDPAAEPNLPPILPIVEGFKGALPFKAAPAAPAPKAQAALKTPAKAEKKADRASAALMDHVLDALDHSNVPLAQEQLLDTLGAPAIEFFAAVDRLEAAGKVFVTRRGRIALPRQLGYVTGAVHLTARGFGFLLPDDGSDDIFLAEKDLNTALEGDTAVVHLNESTGPSREGEVIAITARAREKLVGTFRRFEGGEEIFVPDDRKAGSEYPARNLRRKGAKDGEKVVCELLYDERPIAAKVVEVLGLPDAPGTDILSIVRAHGMTEAFPPRVKAAAAAMDAPILEDDIRRREDLRSEMIVTIDGRDSKDFDDAVSLEKLNNGNYLLGVHIADVAHYVHARSALDNEAYRRGTSVYFTDRVIPMLPEELSNGICSLNPNEDRLALSCFMEIDGKGNVLNHRLSETVIRSKYRLVYDDVSALLAGDAKFRRRYRVIVPLLTTMAELYEILSARRQERGSLEFELPEAKILLDENGRTQDVVLEERGVANRIIEEFMLVCNETVAEHMENLGVPMLYRVHEIPDEDKVQELSAFLSGFGIPLRAKNGLTPKALQTALAASKGKPEEYVVSRVALRSLKRARYCPENLGHFGLAAPYYCHFTSPIRRYPDLVVHRIVKETLRGQLKKSRREALLAALPEIATHTSERERAAVEAEREANDLKKCEYLYAHLGERVPGVISGVTSFGLFVELENTCEGLVRIADMRDDYYVFEEKNYRFIGRHRHAIYRLGDIVEVMIASVDVPGRRVDFELLPKAGRKSAAPDPQNAKGKKAAKRSPKAKKQANRPAANTVAAPATEAVPVTEAVPAALAVEQPAPKAPKTRKAAQKKLAAKAAPNVSPAAPPGPAPVSDPASPAPAEGAEAAQAPAPAKKPAKPRTRKKPAAKATEGEGTAAGPTPVNSPATPAPAEAAEAAQAPSPAKKPAKPRTRKKPAAKAAEGEGASPAEPVPVNEPAAPAPAERAEAAQALAPAKKPAKPRTRKKPAANAAEGEGAAANGSAQAAPGENDTERKE